MHTITLEVLIVRTLLIIHAGRGFCAYPPKRPLVHTSYGAVRGVTRVSRAGKPYEAFTRIPYAEPPIGPLRFKAPEPPKNWDFFLDASKESPICIQKNYLFKNPKIEGSEDCLYLNVYVAKENKTRTALLPVIVYVHWGAFFAGRGSEDYLGPEYFMDKDVVLVTFNYRLGPFGFLTTLDDTAPGNYGLKDQVMALDWVQKNIQNFNGDPRKVTIYGTSAGAGSVHFHLLSPLSKGLFHRAISVSGSALAPWAKLLNAVQANVTVAQALFVGCSTNPNDKVALINCLRNVPAEKLVETQDNFKIFSVDPLIVYTPVVEEKTEKNPKPFLTKDPIEYIKAGEINKVPWITGVMQDEGILRAAALLRQSDIRRRLNQNFTVLMPQLLGLSLSSPNPEDLLKNLTAEYLLNRAYVEITDPNSVQGFIDVYSDRSFTYAFYQSILFHSIKGHKQLWAFTFEYKGQYSYGDQFAATDENINFNWGVSHCDELLYLFNASKLFPPLNNNKDIMLSYLMTDIWTNFAYTGVPSLSKVYNEIYKLDWPLMNITKPEDMKNENIKLLKISGSNQDEIKFNTETGYCKDRMRFWEQQNIFENSVIFT